MSDDDAVASFVLDYELSADDLSEWIGAEPSARRRRTSAAVMMTVWLVLACAGTVTWLVIRHGLLACVSTAPTLRSGPPQAWIWRCHGGSPSGLLGSNAVLVAAVVVLWSLGVTNSVNFWRASPTRQASKMIASPGAAGRYREEISRAGVTSVSPEGVTTHLPWSVVTSVRETDQRFFLFGSAAQARLMLPKRGLTEPMSVPQLSDFLRASASSGSQAP
jgi:hypothetical protein